MVSAHDRVINRVRLQLSLLLFLKHALGFVTLWTFLWGTVILALRATTGIPLSTLLWGLAGVPCALVPAMLLARRQTPTHTAVRALIDQQRGCGGLLMAGEQFALGDWRRSMPELVLPHVSWRSGRAWGLFLTAASFVLLGFLLPQSFVAMGSEPPLEIGQEADKIAGQLTLLKEEAIIDRDRADLLKDKLDQLRRDASGKNPVQTLEALDHLSATAQRAAKEAAETDTRKTERLSKAQTLAEALQKSEGGKSLAPKVLSEAMAELAALTKKAMADNEHLSRLLDEAALKALKKGELSPEQLKKLADALRENKGEIAERLGKLRKAELIDGETLKKCEKCGECKGDELAAFLKKENGGKESVAEMMVRCMQGGRGGVSDDGPSDTPLSLGKKSKETGVKFKEELLPPADLEALKQSKLVDVGKEIPKTEPGGPSKSGALQGANVGGGSANTQTVLPRHRGTVERYFERPTRPTK